MPSSRPGFAFLVIPSTTKLGRSICWKHLETLSAQILSLENVFESLSLANPPRFFIFIFGFGGPFCFFFLLAFQRNTAPSRSLRRVFFFRRALGRRTSWEVEDDHHVGAPGTSELEANHRRSALEKQPEHVGKGRR